MISSGTIQQLKDLSLIYGAMGLSVLGQLCLKKGVSLITLKLEVLEIVRALLSPYIFAGFSFYAISSIIWLFALSKFPLSVAYPAAAFSYVFIIILSAVLFKEPITQFKILGVIFILCGIYFIFKS